MDNLPLPTWALHKLNRVIDDDFHGKVTCHFKEGKLVLVRAERTYVPDAEEYIEEKLQDTD